jgi:NADH-quinone oxidoreductase subunit J
MTLYSITFYILAGLILVSTGLAITRRNLVHAVVYLIISFFGSALLFYLLGAPLLAALEVIIYAGAIMVLFLFIIMMLKVEKLEEQLTFMAEPASFGLYLFQRHWLAIEIVSLLLLIVLIGVLYLGRDISK